jgi:hypothetical protein
MPGAAPSLKRFACHPHEVQHLDGAAATSDDHHERGWRAKSHPTPIHDNQFDSQINPAYYLEPYYECENTLDQPTATTLGGDLVLLMG